MISTWFSTISMFDLTCVLIFQSDVGECDSLLKGETRDYNTFASADQESMLNSCSLAKFSIDFKYGVYMFFAVKLCKTHGTIFI